MGVGKKSGVALLYVVYVVASDVYQKLGIVLCLLSPQSTGKVDGSLCREVVLRMGYVLWRSVEPVGYDYFDDDRVWAKSGWLGKCIAVIDCR